MDVALVARAAAVAAGGASTRISAGKSPRLLTECVAGSYAVSMSIQCHGTSLQRVELGLVRTKGKGPMILYNYVCEQGHRFEAWLPHRGASHPLCDCGATARREWTRAHVGGASAGPSRDDMPTTWMGTHRGDQSVLDGWHKEMVRRERLEEKYPELAGDRRPVIAHEGRFHTTPLRDGDLPAAGADG